MREGWGNVTIKDIAIVDWGNTNLTKKAYLEEGPFIGVSAAGCDGRMDHAEHKRNTPVLSAIGAQCGRMFLPQEDFTAIKNTITFTPIYGVVDPVFLYYLLTFVELPQRGAGQPFISKGDIQKFSVPLPPLEEQRRIVAVLDEAFEGLDRARANTEANLQNARELFARALSQTFEIGGTGWPKSTLMGFCKDFGRGKSRHRPRNDPALYDGPYPFIQTGDLSDANHYILEHNQSYSEFGLQQSKLWPVGTVCIAIVGATIGESGILTFDACFPDSVIGMTPDDRKADAEYIEFLLQFMKSELKEAGKGSARDNINLGTFEERVFPMPSLDVQQTTVELLNKLSKESIKLENGYRDKLCNLENLRQSILQKAFSGELTASKPHTPRTPANDNETLSELVIALAYSRHQTAGQERTFGHVKTQKILSLTESHCDIDLGRKPKQDAAGPNDMPHMNRMEERAIKQQAFKFIERPGGYTFETLPKFDSTVREAQDKLAPMMSTFDRLMKLVIPMRKTEVEVLATVHAAWNNLIIDKAEINNEAIVRAAREDWHPDKMKIDRGKFFEAIATIKTNAIEPDGTAKYVPPMQESLF